MDGPEKELEQIDDGDDEENEEKGDQEYSEWESNGEKSLNWIGCVLMWKSKIKLAN